MNRSKPWEDDPRFDHPDTRLDRYSNAAVETVRVRFSGGATRQWSREKFVGAPGGDWHEDVP